MLNRNTRVKSFPFDMVTIWKDFRNFEPDIEDSFGKLAEKDLLGMEKLIGKRQSLAYSAYMDLATWRRDCNLRS